MSDVFNSSPEVLPSTSGVFQGHSNPCKQSIVFRNTNVFVSYGISIEDNTNLVRPPSVTIDNTLCVRLTMQSQHKLYTEFVTSTLRFRTKNRNRTKGNIMIYADFESVATALQGIPLHTPGFTKKCQENKDICDHIVGNINSAHCHQR